MKFTVITLFPDFIKTLEGYSIIGRAIKNKKIAIKTIDLRDFGLGNYKQVDDKPYGGDPGMLLRVDVAVSAIRLATRSTPSRSRKTILLCPTGKKLNQNLVENFAQLDELILFCGHYEGFDKRIEDYVDEKISIGDYVLSGGEIPAMVIIDAVSRQIPGVLGNPNSLNSESFSQIQNSKFKIQNSAAPEAPQYTRPAEFEGKKVPDVLISGDPKKIKKWQDGFR